MKLFVATHNAHKVREISQILPEFEVIPDDPVGVEENAPDFVGNALIKVRAIAARHPHAWCLADDSGLEVEALDGAPGVRSARYAGEPSDTPKNNALLLKNLEGVTNRRANFTCAVALVDPHGIERSVLGKCFGRIATAPSGAEGFGYDPLFIPEGFDKSFAELTADEKNAISHRGRALAEAKILLLPKRCGSFGAWLRLLRIVNLPTVPGDVFVGAAAALTFGGDAAAVHPSVWWMALASCFLYLFGLVDNDLVGAPTDHDRPLATGEISCAAARVARGLLLFAALIIGSLANLPQIWWFTAFALTVTIVLYNRTKWAPLMGLCRGLNVLCGGLALPFAAAWTVYVTLLTKYSEGESRDPARKRRVGMLIGGLVYLQLIVLLVLTLMNPASNPLLLAGAFLLIALRLFRRFLPGVSAS